MEKLEFNSLKKYWNNYHNADESQGNDPRDKTGSQKSRETPKPVPKPRTKNVAISQNTSAKCTNNRLIHNAPLSSASYWSPDVSSDTTTILQHRQDVLKRCADEMASKKSTKFVDNLTTQYAPLSSTSFGNSDISRGTNRIDVQRPVIGVLANDVNPFRVTKSNEFPDESNKFAECLMTQNNHLPLTTMDAFGSSDGTDSNSTTSEFYSDLDNRRYNRQMSLNRKLPYPFISRKSNALGNNKTTIVSENGNIMAKVMDTSTKGIQQYNIESSTEIGSNTYSCIPGYHTLIHPKVYPGDNITSADKLRPVDKHTPFDNRTSVEQGTPVDTQTCTNYRPDKGTTAKYHSKIDKPRLNRMEIRWNNCLKQQIDTDEKCGAEKVEENYPSILDRETQAKYHCQGARPKDSPFLNKSKSSLPNSDLAETSVRRNDEAKGASCQSKCSSANPDLAEINRPNSKVNLKFETSQNAFHHVIAETTSRQREICHSMLPGKKKISCQSNRSAVVDTLDDFGKWFVKIPLETRFVCMIKIGYEKGFVYDTIVLAAVCSSTEPIFYRGGNDQQKKVNEMRKLKFCDAKGDAFTYLKIYKEWEQVPERQKNKWCDDNALNSKSLRVARELVNEICSIFTNNLKIKVNQTFSTEVELVETLQIIILCAFYENIAHFLGHVKMGYYIPNLQQRVFVHPSSVMYSLNDSSQWLVFMNILKTSRDYISVVTPVEESWIRWATQLKTKQFDINEAKNRSVCSIRSQFFGSTAYSIFVGPDNTKLKEKEDLLYESVQVPVAIAPDRKTGEVKFICGFNVTLPDDLIDKWIAEAKSHVTQRSAEYKVGSNDQTRVRIVLGLGGEGQMILMPDEYRTVHIKSWNKETSKGTVSDKFNKFGQIAYCWEDKDKQSHNRWGRVTFSTPEAAAEAVRRTQNDPKDAAAPEFKIRKHASFQYQATIEWLRRKPTGIVFVEMEYLQAVSLNSLFEVRILGQSCGISLDKKNPSTVRLDKVPTMVTEQDIHSCFPHHSITKITIKREKTFTNPNELSNFQQQIHDQFQEFDQDMKFVVVVMTPRDSKINFRAFIKFNDVSQGTKACDALQGRLTINGQKTKITPTLSTSLSIPEQVYQLLQNKIDDFFS